MADQSSFLKPILQELTYGASSWKKPVKVVATSDITLIGTQTVDGVALAAADEVLCVGQSTGSQNGVWVVSRGAWTRRTDCDSADELFAGCRVSVTQGTRAGYVYRLTTTGRINVGTTSQTWTVDTTGGTGALNDVTATAPIAVSTPSVGVRQVAINPASGLNAGSMSSAHFTLVNGATANSTANTLARRTSGGALRADWFEADGGGAVATTGDVRVPANGTFYGVISSSDAHMLGLSSDVLTVGSSLSQMVLTVAANGVIEMRHGATPFITLLSSGTCGDVGEFRVDADGRLVCWVDSASAEGAVLTEHDAVFHATDRKSAADSGAGDATAMFPITGPMQRAAELVAVHFVPTNTLTASDTDYARIDVFAVDGTGAAGAAIASVTTQVTGGTGNWSSNVPVNIPIVGAGSIPSGSYLAWAIAKPGGTGVIVPAGRIDAQFRYTF